MPPAYKTDFLADNATIIDYVSGNSVRATREEVEAVQPFVRRLVDDFGYCKKHIQVHPQYRVRKNPSDERRSYPVDIAVFRSAKHIESELLMIVECKRKTHNSGRRQLELYMDMSAAKIGIWFNGEEHLYLHKIHHHDGKITYNTLPNIPRYGQRVEDIGLYLRRDLVPPSNLKAIFRDIRNHLAGMTTGITRDEALAQEIINLLFCKLQDESSTDPENAVTFRAGVGEPFTDIQDRIQSLFEQVKAEVYGDVFTPEDRIQLDPSSIAYVVGELQTYCLMEADRDAIGDAFEVFIGPALRGAEGQFFTPRNVVEMIVRMIDPQPADKVLDPACGSGGFLITALIHVWQHLREEMQRKSWTETFLYQRRMIVATHQFKGIDKDSFLSRVCKAYMALIGDGRGNVFCQNTLGDIKSWPETLQRHIGLGTFDIVMTNPPFGKKIVVEGENILSQYDLGYKWKKEQDNYKKTGTLRAKVPPQILFLERCIQLLKPNGRLGIVLPESIFGNPTHRYIVQWLLQHLHVQAVITMPEPLFKTSGKGGTHTKVCVLIGIVGHQDADQPIFMGDVKWCGHDSRGNPTLQTLPNGDVELLDEVPQVANRFIHWQADPDSFAPGRLGFLLPRPNVIDNILIPRYYNPQISEDIKRMEQDYRFVTLAELEQQEALSFITGVEVGKINYGSGRIPFIRTSDISNWEIKTDFKHGVSQAIYEQYRPKADIREEDILMVKDGTYLVGTCAIVTQGDLPMLFQSHLYRIRVLKPEIINPWLLLVLLSTPIVRLQIRAKQFTQDIIDTLGSRVREIAVPIPRSDQESSRLTTECRHIVQTRASLRQKANQLVDIQ